MSQEAKTVKVIDFIDPEDPREWITKPFAVFGKAAGTDGASAFLSNQDAVEAGASEPEIPGKLDEIEGYFRLAAESEFFEAPEMVFPDLPSCVDCEGTGRYAEQACPECDGWGEAEAETDQNTYTVHCKTCDGEGSISGKGAEHECPFCGGKGKRWSDNDRMQIQGVPFDLSPNLISRIHGAKNLQIAVIKDDQLERCIAFKCTDGIGLIMGMRDAK